MSGAVVSATSSKFHPAKKVNTSMAAILVRVLLMSAVCGACGQFGNLEIKWETSAAGGRPRVTEDRSVDFTPPKDVRRTSLSQLPISTLSEIVTSLGGTCERCVSRGHWVSRVRSACLELAPKALKKSLSDRGVKCEGCTMREQYLDRLLDSVHLPMVRK